LVNGLAATAFLNTMLAGGTGMLGWLVVEQRRDGKPTTLGAASGAVAGLVGITPACGFVQPLGGAAIGLVAGMVCALLTWVIAWVLNKTIGLRAAPEHEMSGIDEAEHAETGYEHGRFSGHFLGGVTHHRPEVHH
jgi:ammonia channel protein AmtB